MSTRGSVAWWEGGRVRGVYIHDNSYPTWLGPRLVAQIQELGLSNFMDLLRRVGDWSEMFSDGVCNLCGKRAGQPHNIIAVVHGFAQMSREEFVAMRTRQSQENPARCSIYQREIATLDTIEENRARTGYPDPEGLYHKHGTGAADQFDPFEDALSMEWVYVVLPENAQIEVWACVCLEDGKPIAGYQWSGQVYRTRSGRRYTHVRLRTLDIAGTIDWQAIENQGRALRS